MKSHIVKSFRDSLYRSLSALMVLSMVLSAVGMPTVSAHAAPAGKALQFNGSNHYVTFGSSAGMDTGLGAQVFTIETWFKRTGTGVATGTGTSGLSAAIPLVTKGRGEAEGTNVDMNYFFGIDSATNRLAADFEECASAMGAPCVAGGTAGLNHPAFGTTAIQNNVWYHAAVTYDGRYWTFYLNGVQDGPVTDVGAVRYPRWDSIQHAGIGTAMTSTGAAAGFFAGIVDEVRIWNVVRTQAEIQADMYSELTSGTGLIGRWGLDEGSGVTAANSVAGRPNGALMPTATPPTWVDGFPIPDTTPPAAPTGLTAAPFSGGITLTWIAPGDTDIAGYNVYRSETSPVTLTSPVNGGTLVFGTSYSDFGLTDGTTYYYVVTAVDTSANQSAASNEVGAVPALQATGLNFDGINDYVTLGVASGLGLQTFTLETWFYWTGGTPTTSGTGGVTSGIPLLTKGRGETDNSDNKDMNYFLGIDYNTTTQTGRLAADFEDNVNGGNHPVFGTTTLNKNTWYHAAATYDSASGQWKLYLNGVEDGSVTVTTNKIPRYDSIQHASLGSALQSNGLPTASPAGYFGGMLDEARIWNVARTQAEIMASINSELTSGTGLVARWGMNEGGGTVVHSSIGTFPGTLTNGPTWVTGAPFNITPPPAPSAPSGLVAVASSANNVNLTWVDNSNNETSFEVERGSDAGGPFNLLATVGSNIVTYADASVLPLTQYCYRVRAVGVGGASSYSDVSCVTTPDETAYALDFGSSTAYVTFGDPADLDLPQFTLETWFKRTGAGTSNTTGSGGVTSAIPLVTHGSPQDDGSNVDANWMLVIDDTNDVIAADFEDMATGLNHPVYGTTMITNDVWHHAAATYDGTTWRLYLDGNLEATLVVNAAPRSDTIQHAGLGTMIESDGTVNGHFQGVLDEVRIWNYARTRAQIISTINSQINTAQTGLVARWSLNEGTGTVVNGSAGTTVNGTITNTGYSWVTPGSPFNAYIETTPPAAPTNLMASPRPGAVQLEWTTNIEPDLAGYNVYRSTTSPVTLGVPLNSTALVAPAYTDSVVSAGTEYFYAVTAVDIYGNESPLSTEASAIPLPPPPPEALDLGSANAYVALGDTADTAQFTLEAWIRRDGAGTAISSGSGGETIVPVITNGTADAETENADINYFFGIRGSDGVLCADFEEAQTGAAPGQNHPVCGVTPLMNGTWYHVAATYNGSVMRLYLNGNLDKEQTIGQPANANNISQLAFGTSMKTDNSTTGYFDGVLDEVRIWDYPRTQGEIVGTINAKLSSPQTGLLGRWGFDEGTGSAVNDSSGNAFHGTITGSGYSWAAGSPFNAEVNLSPDAPQLVGPVNGASNVGTTATLSVNVSDPEGQPLNVTFYGRPMQAAAGPDFTLIVIPDAQYYASTYPAIYNAQMQWVVDHKTSDNIVYVASLGDNVDVASNVTQWTNADAAYDILDAANIPYGLAAGNHDGAPSNTGNFNTYFGASRFTGQPTYGGHYGSDNDNHYALFEASGLSFIVIFIEYDDSMTTSSHPVLVWANDLLQTYSSRRAIVISHNMLQGGTSTAFSTQGSTIYNALKANPNLFLIMGGHLDVAARRTDVYNGHTVYTLRSDYQSVDNQQSGYLRIMRFSPTDDMIYVRTYSPTQNKDYDKSDAAQNNFNLSYGMDGVGFSVIGTASSIPSGGTASVQWSGLTTNAQYEWFVVSSDGTHQTSSDTWGFTTAGGNTAPVANDQTVTTTEDTAMDITLTATDVESDPLTYTVLTQPAHGTLAGTAPNLTYTPDLNFNGSDSFTFKANDGTADSNTATVTVNITPVNDAPVCLNVDLVTDEDAIGQVAASCTDVENDPLTYSIVNQPGSGSASVTGSVLEYVPPANFNGSTAFTYKASDGTAESNTASVAVTVNAVNDLPVAAADSYTVAENTTLTVAAPGVLGNDTDAEGSPLTAVKLSDPSSGVLTFNADGSFVYTPATNFHGAVSFTYQANDGTSGGNIATVEITVTPNNYRLSVVVVGSGSVTKNPNQEYYHFGDVVELTASPDAGWQFAGWSGGVTGMDNPVSVTINGDTNITATFTEAPPVCTGILYVDKDSTAPTPNGCNWDWAFRTLQDALTAAPANGTTIWVAEGTYYPDEGAGETNNDRTSSFWLEEGVSIYGGFAGTETLLDERDPETYITILSGDIDQMTGNAGNAYHVVTSVSVSPSTILDGFTITGGNASADGLGGGIYNENASPTLTHLTISANASSNFGGGMYSITSGSTDSSMTSPRLTNVTFLGNTAPRGGGLVTMNSNAILNDVTFVNNTATGGAGGGMNNQTASSNDPASVPVLTNVTFKDNTANGGGGLFNGNSNPILTNVTFSGNTANVRGGAIFNEGSSPILNNVTISGNTAPAGFGGAMRNVVGVAPANKQSNPVIRNSILWGNNAGGGLDEITSDGVGVTAISNSVVEGGCQPAGSVCTNILIGDPLLVALADNGGLTHTMALGAGSSAIDAGDNSTCAADDQRGIARPQGLACDAGAYEVTATTTLTLNPASGEYGGTVTLSATLSYNGFGLGGKTIGFALNGLHVGNAITNASGIATLENVSLAGIGTGSYPGGVTADFTGDPAFAGSAAAADLTVNKATPVITWANPADIMQGTPLGAAQLNATASVPGTFVYEPPAGTILNAGDGQTLSVYFTPDDAVNYNNASASVTINVYACYALTLGHTGQGTDPVADPVQSAGCPAGMYRAGENIQLSGATPGIGSHIAGWTGTGNDSSTAATNALTMPAGAHSVSVNYVLNEYTLTIVSEHGTVTKTPDQSTYHHGDVVTLSVTPDAGWTFTGWTPSLSENKVTMVEDTIVVANYSQNQYTLTVLSEHGTVTKNPEKTAYTHGESVELTATPAAGWHFDHWEGDLTGTTNPASITMDGNKTVTAVFALDVVTHSIALVQGWNLVSFNVHPVDTSLASVLSSIAGKYDLVYAWDATGASAGSGNWLKADNIPYSPDSLTALDETMGFWIHMTAADSLDVQGTIPVSTEIQLSTNTGGWNLVAFPAAANGSLPDVLSGNGVGIDFTLVYTYHANEPSDPWKLFDRLSPPFANDLSQLTPGWGYWVKVSADHTWTIDYSTP